MDELDVYVGSQLFGVLTREQGCYTLSVVRSEPSVLYIFFGVEAKVSEVRSWHEFPPVFDGLLPEGVLLDQLLTNHGLDESDKWSQLAAVGRDTVGCVTIIPRDSGLPSRSRNSFEQKFTKRSPISPDVNALPYEMNELATYYSTRDLRMSISGSQPKLAAIFSRKEKQFRVVEQDSSYILKLSSPTLPDAVENEALTMLLAREAGMAVPPCGYLKTTDGHGVYWIERFDRLGQGNLKRLRCEDACQVLGVPSSDKYSGSYELLAQMIRDSCSNPKFQLARLFHRALFSWVIGNAEMHLKNWSLVQNGPLIELSPVYDFLNTVILSDGEGESALALGQQTQGFTKDLLLGYFAKDVCELNDRMIHRILDQLRNVNWSKYINQSQLGEITKRRYLDLVQARMNAFLFE